MEERVLRIIENMYYEIQGCVGDCHSCDSEGPNCQDNCSFSFKRDELLKLLRENVELILEGQ